ncbi:MAG: uroporphyrinogen-III synthase [Anderseniella sp.]|nr:uroporphyrinogen-III synthase [Anderseniella sp.]
MAVIVTRPEPDASRLAERLARQGDQPLLCPLMQIEVDDTATVPRGNYQAILVTSANGLRALESRNLVESLQGTPVIAVGPASARLAGELGFAEVREAAGNVEALADLVRRTLSRELGPLLYVTGKSRAGDLKADLEHDGFEVDRVELYGASPAGRLDPAVSDALRNGEADAVLLYSPRTARIWAKLVRQDGLAGKVSDLRHVCLSQAVAEALHEELGRNLTVAVASSPDDDAMLEAMAHDSKNKTGETDMANRKTTSRSDRKAKKPAVIDATATEVDESTPAEESASEAASPAMEAASGETVTQDAETGSAAAEDSSENAANHIESTKQEASPQSQKPSGKGKWIAAGMAAILLAGLGGGGYLYHAYGERLFGQPTATADIAAMESQVMDAAGAAQSAREAASQASTEVSALAGRLEGIEQQVSELAGKTPEDASQLVSGIRQQAEAASTAAADLDARTKTLEQTTADLRQSVEAVQTALDTAAASGGGVDQTALNLKLDELAARITAVETQAPSPPEALAGEVSILKEQLSASEERIAALSAQLEAVNAQVATLAGRLEEAAASPEADVTGETAAIARIGEAIASLDAAVKSGSAFDAQLAALREAAPGAPALPSLDANAATGIPGQAALQQQLETVAAALAARNEASGSAPSGFFASLQDKLSSVVKVRSLDKPDWQQASARALEALKAVGPQAAIAALPADADGMPDGLKQWLIEARKHAAAMHELERLPQLLLSSTSGQQQ